MNTETISSPDVKMTNLVRAIRAIRSEVLSTSTTSFSLSKIAQSMKAPYYNELGRALVELGVMRKNGETPGSRFDYDYWKQNGYANDRLLAQAVLKWMQDVYYKPVKNEKMDEVVPPQTEKVKGVATETYKPKTSTAKEWKFIPPVRKKGFKIFGLPIFEWYTQS